jgi:hypothetical protein
MPSLLDPSYYSLCPRITNTYNLSTKTSQKAPQHLVKMSTNLNRCLRLSLVAGLILSTLPYTPLAVPIFAKQHTSLIATRTDSEKPSEWLGKHEYEEVERCYLYCANSESMQDHHKCMESCFDSVILPPFLPMPPVDVETRAPLDTFNSEMGDPPGDRTHENIWNNCRLACSSTEVQIPAEIEICAQTCMRRHEECPVGFCTSPPKPTWPAGFIPVGKPGSGGAAAPGTYAGIPAGAPANGPPVVPSTPEDEGEKWYPDGFIPVAGTEETRYNVAPDGTFVVGTTPPKKRSGDSVSKVSIPESEGKKWYPDGFIPVAGTEQNRYDVAPDGTLVVGTTPPKKRSDESFSNVPDTPTKTKIVIASDSDMPTTITTNDNFDTIEQV